MTVLMDINRGAPGAGPMATLLGLIGIIFTVLKTNGDLQMSEAAGRAQVTLP